MVRCKVSITKKAAKHSLFSSLLNAIPSQFNHRRLPVNAQLHCALRILIALQLPKEHQAALTSIGNPQLVMVLETKRGARGSSRDVKITQTLIGITEHLRLCFCVHATLQQLFS